MFTTPTTAELAVTRLMAETVSQAEAAERLEISLPALRARVHRGRIPTVRVGRTVRIPLAAVRGGEAA